MLLKLFHDWCIQFLNKAELQRIARNDPNNYKKRKYGYPSLPSTYLGKVVHEPRRPTWPELNPVVVA